MEKSIIITGGAGFIGSHLSERLLNEGYKVIIIDNFNSFYDPKIKEKNINYIEKQRINLNLDKSYLKVYKGDIRNKNFLNKVFSQNQIDIIIHLASMAGVRPSLKNPELYYDVNVNGTLNLLEECQKRNIKKFIFSSSSSVYGNNKKVPFSENDFVDNPISPYAATKKSGELLCHTYYHNYDISVTCLRFFTVYGPRQRPDLAIHKFTKLLFNDEEIPYYGDGSTERDYTYISDIIDGIIKTIEWIDKNKKQFEIFNLGGSKTTSLNLMLETLEKAVGKKAKIKRFPLQPGDVNRTFADISKSKETLNYCPQTSFEDGIIKFVEWYKEINDL